MTNLKNQKDFINTAKNITLPSYINKDYKEDKFFKEYMIKFWLKDDENIQYLLDKGINQKKKFYGFYWEKLRTKFRREY